MFRTTLIVLGTVALGYLLYLIGELFLVLFLASVFASTIRPIVERLVAWRVPQGLAAVLVALSVVGLILGLLLVVTPPLVGMTIEFFKGDRLMDEVRKLASWLTFFGWDQFHIVLPTISLPVQVARLLNLAEDTAREQAWPLAGDAAFAVAQLVLMLVMAIYWLTSRKQTLALLLRLSPVRHRSQIEEIWNDVETALGAYVRGQLVLMVIVGGACLLGLAVLGVPYAPALAIIAGLTEAIPIVGPLIGGVPAVLLGLTVSWQTALFVGVWYVVVQQLEAHLLVPRIMHRAVGLNPILVIMALIAGAMLKGVVGALIAVPVVGALQVIARHIWLDPTIERHAALNESGILVAGQGVEQEPVVSDQD